MESEIQLNDTEWEVMECLWQNSPRTLMQLVEQMRERLGWSKSTTATMVRRMEAKGYIRHEEGERARKYYPVPKRGEVARTEARSLLKRVFHGNLGLLVNSLVPENSLSAEDIMELRRILHKAGGEEDD